jgi:hypothetical protein
MPKVNWISFGIGVLFAMFVLPLILGFVQSRTSGAKVAK